MAEKFISKIGLMAAKVESVEGTAVSPAAADAVIVHDPKFEPDPKMNEQKPLAADGSPYPSIPGGRSAKISFKTFLKGSGAAGVAPEYGELFRLCRYAETVVAATSVAYDPITFGDVSGTIVLYWQNTATTGKKIVLRGCRGNWKLGLVDGEPMYIEWDFTAADYTETDSAPLSGMSYDSTSPLIFAGVTLTVDSIAFNLHKLDIDAGNEVGLIEDIAKASGYLAAIITGNNPVGAIDPHESLVATYGMEAKLRAGTLVPLSCVSGSVAGNIVTITAPKSQYIKASPSDRANIRTRDVNLKFCRSAGNDHLKIKFT